MRVIPGSPIMQGALQGSQLKSNTLSNQAMQDKLKTLPEALKAQLIAQQQQAQQAQYQTQFMPEQLQAALALKQAQTPLTQSQTSANQMRTSMMPQQQAIAIQNALNKQRGIGQSMQRFGPANTTIRMMNNPVFKSLYHSNDQFANSVNRIAGGTADTADMATADKVLSSAGLPTFSQSMTQQGAQDPMQQGLTDQFRKLIGSQGGGQAPQMGQAGQAPQMGQAPSQSGLTPELIQQIRAQQNQMASKQLGMTPESLRQAQDVAQSDIEKKTTIPKVLQDRTAGLALNKMIDSADERIADVASFTGAAGSGKLAFNELLTPEG